MYPISKKSTYVDDSFYTMYRFFRWSKIESVAYRVCSSEDLCG